jgi:hypothetical protein
MHIYLQIYAFNHNLYPTEAIRTFGTLWLLYQEFPIKDPDLANLHGFTAAWQVLTA